MTQTATSVDQLYKGRRGTVEIVDVPELLFASVSGQGEPGGGEYTAALQSLYAVSYGAHFILRRESGVAPRVMPLESLWWVEDPAQQDLVAAVALGKVTMADADRAQWRWQAMIMQPDPVDEQVLERAVAQSRATSVEALDRVRFTRWEEGRCAQILHVGPYAEESPTIAALHEGISTAGYRPRGRHHEIYLGDPRRSAPERLRTLLRQPVEPA